MKVERWAAYDDVEGNAPESGIGGIGGWFGWTGENSWADYEGMFTPPALPYVHALRDEIVAKEIRRGGDWHQDSSEGVPVFSDGTVALYSYRAWGDLLAAIWSEEDGEPYNYMNFYMDCWMSPDPFLDSETEPSP